MGGSGVPYDMMSIISASFRVLKITCAGVVCLCLILFSFTMNVKTPSESHGWIRGYQGAITCANIADFNSSSLQSRMDTQVPSLQVHCQRKASTPDNCLDMMMNRTALVSAMSSDHFKESSNLIGSIQNKMPGAKMIIYDLGLTVSQVAELRKMCNVELRPFKFSCYPPHVSPNYLKNYAWKPLVVKEVSLEYEIVVWADTSIRFKTSLKEYIYPYLLTAKLTYVGIPAHSHKINIAQYTHDETIAYLNLTRAELTKLPQIQSGFGVYWMTEPVKEIVNEWADCAMNECCIAPKGASVSGPWPGFYVCRQRLGGPDDVKYSGCHRFDQSALGLILYKHYGRSLSEILRPLAWNTCAVMRADSSQRIKISKC